MGYGAIMSYTGASEFVIARDGLSFRFNRGTGPNHIRIHRNGGHGRDVEFSTMDEKGRRSGTRRHRNVPPEKLRELFEAETGVRMPVHPWEMTNT